MSERVFGLILAGGRSSRFGREKAVAELGGEPLIAWVARALRPAVERIAVSAPEASQAAAFAGAQGWRVLPDGDGMDSGPLAGVLQGLRWGEADGAGWLATLPCDAPSLPADTVSRLVRSRSTGGAVARTPDGLQPLCALWPVGAAALLASRPDHPAVRWALGELGAAEVAFDDAGAFANLNTQEALAAAEARVGRRAPSA